LLRPLELQLRAVENQLIKIAGAYKERREATTVIA